MSVDLERKPRRSRDYQRFLDHQLAQAQNRIKTVDIVTGMIICLVGAVAYALSVTMLDQLFVLSTTTRIVLLALFTVATLAYLAYAVIIPSLRRINLLYAARQVERADPSTKNSLVNWLLLRDHDKEIPESLMQAIEARAATDMHRIDLGEAIQTTHILRATYVLGAVVVLFCMFLFTTTKELTPSLKRVLFPLAEIAPPTETKLTQIDPGSTEIAAGDKVTISAYASGQEPTAVMAYVTADEGEYWEPIPLTPPTERFGQWQVTLNDRQKSFEYYLVANDFKSGHYFITVTAAPMVTDWAVTYHFPAYTGEAARTDPGGDIDAIEGTEVEVELTTNVPVKEGSGRLELKLGKQRTKVELKRAGDAENKLTGKFNLTTDGSYEAVFEDLLGRKPQFRPVKNIRVRKDLEPVLAFVEPKEAEIQRPPQAQVAIRLSASDDYGLDRVKFMLQRRGDAKVLMEQELGPRGEPIGRSRVFLIPIDLTAHDLKVGDQLVYWAEGEDNKRPVSNAVSTQAELRTIEIVEPPKEQPTDKKPEPGQQGDQAGDSKNEQAGDDQNQQQDQRNQGERDADQQTDQGQPGESGEKSSKDSAADSKQGDASKGQPGNEGTTKGEPEQQPNAEDQRPKDSDAGSQPENTDGKQGDKNPSQGEPGTGTQRESSEQGQRGDPGSTPQSSSPEEKLSDKDKESLEKLKDYFNKKNQEQPSKSTDPKSQPNKSSPSSESGQQNPSAEERSAAPEDSSAKQTQPEQPAGKSEGSQAPDQPPADRQLSEQPKEPGEPKSAEKQPTAKESAEGAKSADESADPKRSAKADAEKQPAGQDPSNAERDPASKQDPVQKPGDNSQSKDQGAGESKSDAAPKDKAGGEPKGTKEQPTNDPQKEGDRPNEASAKEKSDSKQPDPSKSNPESADPQKSENRQADPKQPENQSPDQPSSEPKQGSKPEQSGEDQGSKQPDQGDKESMSDQQKQGQSSESKSGAKGGQEKPDASKESGEKQNQPGSESGQESGQGSEQRPQKESDQPGESKPTAGSKESKEQDKQSDPKRSYKHGDQDSAAAEQPKSEGNSSEGEGSQAGESNSGKGKEGEGDSPAPAGNKPEQQGKGEGRKSSDVPESSDTPEKGSGASGGQPSEGEKNPTDGQKGSSGGKAADGKAGQGEPSDSSDSKPSATEPGGAEGAESGDAANNQSRGQPQGDGPNQLPKPAGDQAPEDTSTPAENSLDNSGDAANPEDLKEGGNLVLRKLQEELKKKQIDPDLLKDMGWTEEEARKFANRLEESSEPAEKPADPLVGKEREGFGNGSQLRKSSGRAAGQLGNDAQQDLFGGRRAAPPPEYRELFEAYTRSLSKTAASPPAPKKQTTPGTQK